MAPSPGGADSSGENCGYETATRVYRSGWSAGVCFERLTGLSTRTCIDLRGGNFGLFTKGGGAERVDLWNAKRGRDLPALAFGIYFAEFRSMAHRVSKVAVQAGELLLVGSTVLVQADRTGLIGLQSIAHAFAA